MNTQKERKWKETKTNLKELSKKQAESIINLFTSLGIKIEDIFPKYCGGGKIKKLTDGRYKFDQTIPEDTFILNELLEIKKSAQDS